MEPSEIASLICENVNVILEFNDRSLINILQKFTNKYPKFQIHIQEYFSTDKKARRKWDEFRESIKTNFNLAYRDSQDYSQEDDINKLMTILDNIHKESDISQLRQSPDQSNEQNSERYDKDQRALYDKNRKAQAIRIDKTDKKLGNEGY